MTRVAVRLTLLAALLPLAAPGSAAAQITGREPRIRLGQRVTILRDVTVIDGTGGQEREHVSVLIVDDLIQGVGRPEDLPLVESARVATLTGKYLLPGFVDAEARFRGPADLAGMLAAGIVTIRNPRSATVDGVDYREAVGKKLPGPRIFTAGQPLDAAPGHGPDTRPVQDEKGVRTAVREEAEAGADFIQLSAGLPFPLVRAAIFAARTRHLPVAGDLVETSWTEAARSGIDVLGRIVSLSPKLLPAEARDTYRQDVVTGRAHPYYRWLELVDPDGPEIDEMIGALLSRDVMVIPTLAGIESVLLCGDPTFEAEIAAYGVRAPEGAACLSADRTPDHLGRARAAWPVALSLTRQLEEAGVRLLAGSDAPIGRLPPGLSFHRELELLVRAGLSPLDVLSIATRNGAVSVGDLHESGTIEPGKRADLILLDADPLADIRNTRKIEWVMVEGKLFFPRKILQERPDGP
ncbi:MAG: amidohydrolase family protein [Gemmatimonadota bacterium]